MTITSKFASIAVATFALLAVGCATSTKIPKQDIVQLPQQHWSGTWFGKSLSYYGHESSNGLLLRRDGTGYIINSAIFEPRHNPSFWVRKMDFTWNLVDQTTAKGSVIGSQTLAGGGEAGLRGRNKDFNIVATRNGLRISSYGLQESVFLKYPESFSGDMAARVTNETRTRALAMGGNETPYSGPTFAQIALGALNSYQKGISIGNAISGGGSGSSNSNAGSDINGYVTLGSTEMAAYTDGKAYDVLTLLPVDGSSGGEWCYQYGIPIGNARSLLATGYALAADRSAYGAGNPRQIISWRSVSVSKGSRIRMGIEWKKGQMVSTPLQNRYEVSRP